MLFGVGTFVQKVMMILYGNRFAAIYSFGLIAVFALTYHLMGMNRHFNVPDYLKGRENSFLSSLYTSVMAQNNAMPDITPKSNVARILFMAQVSMGWMWFLLFNNQTATSIIVL